MGNLWYFPKKYFSILQHTIILCYHESKGNMIGKTVVVDCPLCLCFMTNIKVTNMKKKTQQGNMSGKTVADSFVLLCVTLGGGDPSLPPISQIAPQIIISQC